MNSNLDKHIHLQDYFHKNAVQSFFLSFSIFQANRTIISDSEVDNLFASDISRIQPVAQDKLDLSDEIILSAPDIIKSPIYWNKSNMPESDILWRIGKDNCIRVCHIQNSCHFSNGILFQFIVATSIL